MPDYKPNSHFFADHSNLANSAVTNLAADAYGSVSGALTNKYRTTSFVRASALAKVFAICDGQIMIQPETGDDIKIILQSGLSPLFMIKGIRTSIFLPPAFADKGLTAFDFITPARAAGEYRDNLYFDYVSSDEWDRKSVRNMH